MRIGSLILATMMVVSPALDAQTKKATPLKVTPLSAPERRILAGLIGTLDIVEARLQRDVALDVEGAAANVKSALDLLATLQSDSGPMPLRPPTCGPGQCPDDGGCKPCYAPYGNLITLNGYLWQIKGSLMAGKETDEPAIRRYEKRVLTVAQKLVALVSKKEPLTASGFCSQYGILMPCKPQDPDKR